MDGRYQRSEQNSQRKTVGGSKNENSLIAQSFGAGLKITGTQDVDRIVSKILGEI